MKIIESEGDDTFIVKKGESFYVDDIDGKSWEISWNPEDGLEAGFKVRELEIFEGVYNGILVSNHCNVCMVNGRGVCSRVAWFCTRN